MRILKTILFAVFALATLVVSAKEYSLKNDKVEVVIGKKGELVSLKNLATGHDYASGGYLWRMYYDTKAEQEIRPAHSQVNRVSANDTGAKSIFRMNISQPPFHIVP